MKDVKNEQLVKILFDVDTGDGPLPPLKVESLWAEVVTRSTAKLRNIPYFACYVALGDLVKIRHDQEGLCRFVRVIEPSSNSTVHAFIWDEDQRIFIRDFLLDLGCTIEIGPIPSYWAINVPSYSAAEGVVQIKERYTNSEDVQFQVSCSRHEPVLQQDV